MKIVIFGVGEIFKKYKDRISKEDEIVAFLDNNQGIQGSKIDGVQVCSPESVKHILYDKIVIMSGYYHDIKRQLFDLGCAETDILYYAEYITLQYAGKLEIYFGRNVKRAEKRALIITTPLGYHGGPMASVYMAIALQRNGYETAIAAPNGNKQFIKEFIEKGISFFIYPNLQFADWDELVWIQHFQSVVVSTYPMILCALKISMHRRVSLWLHESNIIYPTMDFWKDKIIKEIFNANLDIYAVSRVAKNNFIENVENCNIEILPLGIPDDRTHTLRKNEKLRFAVVGVIHPVKQQLLYLDAIERLESSIQKESEFLIVGGKGDRTDYAELVEKRSESLENVKIIGELTQGEMKKLYSTIDILVVSSLQETMSLTAAEAMMFGKTCILCDSAGMAEFIRHGENGLLYTTGSEYDLAQQICFCIKNRKKLDRIGRNARKTYEQFFSIDAFAERLKNINK